MEAHFTSDTVSFDKVTDAYGKFNPFYPSTIFLDEKEWPTVEHYFQAQKFENIDQDYASTIRKSLSPTKAQVMGKSTEKPLREDWEEVKYSIMVKALTAKFTQHESLRQLLLGTENKPIVYANPLNYEWGCGKEGTGQNLLGRALVEVRESLKKKQ